MPGHLCFRAAGRRPRPDWQAEITAPERSSPDRIAWPATSIRRSPGRIPALSAAEPGTTVAIATPGPSTCRPRRARQAAPRRRSAAPTPRSDFATLRGRLGKTCCAKGRTFGCFSQLESNAEQEPCNPADSLDLDQVGVIGLAVILAMHAGGRRGPGFDGPRMGSGLRCRPATWRNQSASRPADCSSPPSAGIRRRSASRTRPAGRRGAVRPCRD